MTTPCPTLLSSYLIVSRCLGDRSWRGSRCRRWDTSLASPVDGWRAAVPSVRLAHRDALRCPVVAGESGGSTPRPDRVGWTHLRHGGEGLAHRPVACCRTGAEEIGRAHV